jgi:hypothetical protein
LKQFESLRQIASVAEYQAQFKKLAYGILLYNPSYDHVYFVTRFLAGLKEEIHALIALHRPRDVDTDSTLALLQEEEINAAKNKSFGWGFTKGFERAMTEKARLAAGEKLTNKGHKIDFEDKLASLKQYQRKTGLCFKCGGKWSPNHSCPEQIPLHVLEELWDALDLATSEESVDVQSDTTVADDSVFELQSSVPDKYVHRHTLKLLARIGKHQVLVLVDSGSIGTFIIDKLVQALGLHTESCQSVTFKAADGGQLPCSEQVPALQWCV